MESEHVHRESGTYAQNKPQAAINETISQNNNPRSLCVPHPAESLRDTDVVRLELVQTDSRAEGERAEQPDHEGVGLGDTASREVVGDGGAVIN